MISEATFEPWKSTMKRLWVVLLAALLLTAAGCSTKGGAQGEGAAGPGGASGGKADGPRIGKYRQGGGAYDSSRPGGAGRYGAGGELDEASGPLARRVIYFPYDSYEVLPEYQPVVAAHANYLASHPERRVTLEGHADERGSPEYNIALGEQRAKAVQRLMELQGVGSGQIQVVSFGEEKPAALGHDEASWQQNRRVEISYSRP
ncbi:peptidoglycan-associated lipoprotein Pal [Candidatus Methylocalor cossyra]